MTQPEVWSLLTGSAAVVGWIETRVRSIVNDKLKVHEQRVSTVEKNQDRLADNLERLSDSILQLTMAVGRMQGQERGEA